MIKRQHIHILDVVSVLLFALLANFVFGLEVDFHAPIDFFTIGRLILLTSATFTFYLTVDFMKKVEREAIREYDGETDAEAKAAKSIDQRYTSQVQEKSGTIRFAFVVVGGMLILFFFIEPSWKYFVG